MINTIWSIITGICLSVGMLHLLVWVRSRHSRANLWFAITAFAGAAMAIGELHMMRSTSPEEYGQAIRLLHIPVGMVVVSLAWFIRFYLQAGKTWLAWLITALRGLVIILTFILTPNLNFKSIAGLREFNAWGETVVVAVGEKNPWTNLTHLSALLLVAFVVDASISAWRRKNHRSAAVIGISFGLAISAAVILSELFNRGVLPMPLAISPLFLIIVLGIAYEMAHDLVRKNELSDALEKNRQRMALAVAAANLGMWEWDIPRDECWANEVTRRRIGVSPSENLTLDRILKAIHAEDRADARGTIDEAISRGGDFNLEYRMVEDSGRTRWLIAQGKAEKAADGTPVRLLGVSIDVTALRVAEAAAREAGGRLISAQEKERARIARELHDHINQQLALLTIRFDAFRKKQEESGDDFAPLDEIAGQLKQVSSEIHGLSTRLHPAILDQLGLEAACRSLCLDFFRQAGIAIEFVADDVPSWPTGDVALEIYRILQEALANVIRHSGSEVAQVVFEGSPDGLRLTVRDFGSGLDLQSVQHQGGLGLVSMRERARLLRGRLEIHSSPDSGTCVELNVGLPPCGGAAST